MLSISAPAIASNLSFTPLNAEVAASAFVCTLRSTLIIRLRSFMLLIMLMICVLSFSNAFFVPLPAKSSVIFCTSSGLSAIIFKDSVSNPSAFAPITAFSFVKASAKSFLALSAAFSNAIAKPSTEFFAAFAALAMLTNSLGVIFLALIATARLASATISRAVVVSTPAAFNLTKAAFWAIVSCSVLTCES